MGGQVYSGPRAVRVCVLQLYDYCRVRVPVLVGWEPTVFMNSIQWWRR